MISLICDRCSNMYQTDRITPLCGPCQNDSHQYAVRPINRLEIAYAADLARRRVRNTSGAL